MTKEVDQFEAAVDRLNEKLRTTRDLLTAIKNLSVTIPSEDDLECTAIRAHSLLFTLEGIAELWQSDRLPGETDLQELAEKLA